MSRANSTARMPEQALGAQRPRDATRPCIDWTILRRLIGAWFQDRAQFREAAVPRTCPICGHTGRMIGVGHPARWNARCARCGSRERHRLLWLWATLGGSNRLSGKAILHFAPEKALRRALQSNPTYETADLLQNNVQHRVDITNLPLADARFDFVIANHVLEHIPDDRRAMRELWRILKPGGTAVLTVPINPTRSETYENASVHGDALQRAHFTAPDHQRFYGQDFADRLVAAGFSVETFRMSPPEEVSFGLLPTEILYLAHRPHTPVLK